MSKNAREKKKTARWFGPLSVEMEDDIDPFVDVPSLGRHFLPNGFSEESLVDIKVTHDGQVVKFRRHNHDLDFAS